VIASKLYKFFASVFVPDVAKNMDKEGTFNLGEEHDVDVDAHPHVVVEDNGSDVTIFSFAGMAVLFAGMPTFEFRKLLKEGGKDYNLVFFRDVRRSAYLQRPDGQLDGLNFYESEVRRIINELGSTYNIGMGASVGGAAAMYLGLQCKFDQLIMFSPVLHRDVYTRPTRVMRHIFDVPTLIREPQAYMEVSLMTLGALAIRGKVQKMVGLKNWVNVGQAYVEYGENRPLATIYHGRRCSPDCITAARLKHLPEVKVVEVETGRHNCAAIVKKTGTMGQLILDEIEWGLGQRGPSTRREAAPEPAAHTQQA